MMANMPPMRFNYQQRVGRAGRRGAAVSIALTLCRGRSHDDYYFQRPERITADPPPPPYVDTNRRQILQRVFNKEVLRSAFAELALFADSAGDSVHGEFGRADAWGQPQQRSLPATLGKPSQKSFRNGSTDIQPKSNIPATCFLSAPNSWQIPPSEMQRSIGSGTTSSRELPMPRRIPR
jgi:hypothetical protein